MLPDKNFPLDFLIFVFKGTRSINSLDTCFKEMAMMNE